MKRVKAWAVVDKDGNIDFDDIAEEKSWCDAWVDTQSGERVVPVEIVIQEEK